MSCGLFFSYIALAVVSTTTAFVPASTRRTSVRAFVGKITDDDALPYMDALEQVGVEAPEDMIMTGMDDKIAVTSMTELDEYQAIANLVFLVIVKYDHSVWAKIDAGEPVDNLGLDDDEDLDEGLLTYRKPTSVDESLVMSALSKVGGTIVANSQGVESIEDPGYGSEAVVTLAPVEAIDKIISSNPSLQDSKHIAINYLGSDHLQVAEVANATRKLVDTIQVGDKTTITVNSLGHLSFPDESVTVTIVTLDKDLEEAEAEAELSAVEKNLVRGMVFQKDGEYWTVSEDDRADDDDEIWNPSLIFEKMEPME